MTPGASSGLGGPGGQFIFNDNTLDIAWAPNPPVPVEGQNFLVAQIVLSDDAQGEFHFQFTSGDGNGAQFCGDIGADLLGGASPVCVPEPAAIRLGLLALWAMVAVIRVNQPSALVKK